MRPAFLSFIESLVDGCIIADERPAKDFFIDDCRQRLVSVLSSHVDGEGSVVGFFARSGETHDTIARPSTRPAVARATRPI